MDKENYPIQHPIKGINCKDPGAPKCENDNILLILGILFILYELFWILNYGCVSCTILWRTVES